MIYIESLKSYIGKISDEEFADLAKRIYEITDFICEDYPKHREWYFHKQLPRIFTPNGEILFARADDDTTILAMACLKKAKKKRKFVLYTYQINVEVNI